MSVRSHKYEAVQWKSYTYRYDHRERHGIDIKVNSCTCLLLTESCTVDNCTDCIPYKDTCNGCVDGYEVVDNVCQGKYIPSEGPFTSAVRYVVCKDISQ